MKIMNIPGFTAEMTLYRTNRHYPFTAVLAADSSGRVFPAVSKGTFCTVHDPNCSSGFSKLRCTTFNPDDCVETGICCTPTGGGGGGGTFCGDHTCPPGATCCGPSCCPPNCCPSGKHCCSDGDGCCDAGWECRSIFGYHFCDPIFFTGRDTRPPFSNQLFAAVAPRDRVYFGSRTTLMA
jgi:hypothetical protein